MNIISREEAKEKGLKFYFTGKPCHLGHISKRYVNNWNCFGCVGKGSEKYNKKLEKMKEKKAEKKKLKQEQFLASLPLEIKEKLITREEAIEKGLNRYFTGVACIYGHMAERETAGRACIICKNQKQRERRATPEGKAKQTAAAKKRWANKEQRAKQIEARKNWAKENPERIKELKRKDWYKHHEKNLARSQAYERKRYKEDPVFRLRMNLPKQIRQVLLDQGTRKDEYTLELVGCTIPELKNHIEDQFTEGMTWENYSKDGWHIDHVRPCASFVLSNKSQWNVCFNWRNLQPLWGLENTVKKDRYSEQDEMSWTKRMRNLGFKGELYLKYSQKKY